MFEVTVYVHHQLPYGYCYIWTIFFIQPPEGALRYDARDLDQVDSCAVGGIEETLADSACCSPAHVFHSAAQSPTHTASDFEDARSEPPLSSPEVMSTLPVEALLVGSMPPPPPPPPPMANNNSKPHPLQSQDSFNEIRRAPDNGSGLKRRPSRGSTAGGTQSKSHSRSHSRRVSDFSDMELPPLEALLFAHHLHFHPEEDGMTPDENDLFPSTPLDEDQLQHADNRLKEQLGSVIINQVEVSRVIFYFSSQLNRSTGKNYVFLFGLDLN